MVDVDSGHLHGVRQTAAALTGSSALVGGTVSLVDVDSGHLHVTNLVIDRQVGGRGYFRFSV